MDWKLPPEIYRNGLITGHVIQYNWVGSNEIEIKNVDSVTAHTISGLVAHTEYSVKVAAKTINGTGPFSKTELQVSGEDSKFIIY